MMRLLDNVLPSEYKAPDGSIFSFRTDFRDWIMFETLMLDKDVPDRDKAFMAAQLIFPKLPDCDVSEFMLWFYRGGTVPKKRTKNKPGRTGSAAYSYEHDEELIYAAFMQCYKIDLCEADMHWWKFRALFEGLSEDTKLRKVMGYRTMDISEKALGAERAKHYKELKAAYALPKYLSEQQKINEMKRILNKG